MKSESQDLGTRQSFPVRARLAVLVLGEPGLRRGRAHLEKKGSRAGDGGVFDEALESCGSSFTIGRNAPGFRPPPCLGSIT